MQLVHLGLATLLLMLLMSPWMVMRRRLNAKIEQLSRDALMQWAASRRLDIINCNYHYWYKGPFILSHAGQPVYFVTLRDATGKVIEGWVRCGAYSFGGWTTRIEAKLNARS